MKISLNWLGLFVDLSKVSTGRTARDIAHEYSIHTAEIEWIESTGRIDWVVIGKVLTAERHPESTKLWICRVNVGNWIEETILTGAPNVYPGMYTAVALVGCKISPDFVIGERKMAGMMSRGMMCGEDEIGLSHTSSGWIIDLGSDYSAEHLEPMVGKSIFDLSVPILSADGNVRDIPLLDTVLEIDNKNITNRPDLFGIYGHSREFSAVFDAPRTRLDVTHLSLDGKDVDSDFSGIPQMKLDIETDKVLSYSILKVEGVKVSQSPFWVRLLLERSGHTSHDALVDMTNYLMMELGQPMHAFDADTIEGNVVVRQANDGESLTALDGKTYELTKEDIVIADNQKVLAIAGIMGGMDTGIGPNTKNVCIESAVFDPTSIRLTAQRLGLRSEASTRFEKSLDPTLSISALKRAIQFLNFAKTGGAVSGFATYIDSKKLNEVELKLSHDFIVSRIGTQLDPSEILRTLDVLEFSPTQAPDGEYLVKVPSHRATKDIRIVEDIVEEIGRIHGYDTIPESPIPGEFAITQRNDWVALRNSIQNHFVGQGFSEAYNYSFSNEAKDQSVLMDSIEDAIRIQNAVSQEFTVMRRSMAPLLLQNLHENLKSSELVRFFEIARVHHKNSEGMQERKMLAGVLSHSSVNAVRVLLDGLFQKLWVVALVHQWSSVPFLHPNASGVYVSEANGSEIARFGQLHPKVLQNFELPADAWYFEVEIAVLEASISKVSTYLEPNKYPSVMRELNFVLQKNMSTGDVARKIATTDNRIHSLSVVDVYEHEKIGIGNKSVTFSFVIEDRTKTITDDEALAVQQAVIANLEKESIMLRR